MPVKVYDTVYLNLENGSVEAEKIRFDCKLSLLLTINQTLGMR
jgi:hypothetical protein